MKLLSLLTPFILIASLSAQSISPTALVQSLLPSADSNTSAILGQALELSPFTLTILTNETHALVTFNLTTTMAKVGWVSVGFGTTMGNAAMVVLWPQDSTTWLLSYRKASGHSQPHTAFFPSSIQTKPTDPFTLVPSLSSSDSNTVVSFLRPLTLDPQQDLFLNDLHLNLSRAKAQELIYAYSKSRPEGTADGAVFAQHDDGMFGSVKIDLANVFVPQTPTGGTTEGGSATTPGETGAEWTKYDTIVFAHAGVAMVVWLLIAPLAVLIARLGRQWSNWFRFHSSIQLFVTLPATIAVIGMGLAAARWGGSSDGLTGHKLLGILLTLLLLLQLAIGYWSHKVRHVERLSRPWWNVVHILLGLVILLGAWIQSYLGFGKYTVRKRAASVSTLYGAFITAFLAFYLASITLLVLQRKREGRPWSLAVLGLGRDAASEKTPQPWVGRIKSWAPASAEAELEDVRVDEGPKKEGDLSAWR